MTWRNRWVVLAPGEVAWLEKRTREILDEEEDGSENNFIVVPGEGRYQAIVEKEGVNDSGHEMLLGDLLSRECEEAVYAIHGNEEWQYITRFMRGKETREDQEAESLVRSLGCVMPWTDEPLMPFERDPRTVALIKGLSRDKVLRVLKKEAGDALPLESCRLEEIPQGVLLGRGARLIGSVLARRYPRATVYSVTATPNLERFFILVKRGREIEEFSHPADAPSYFPVIHEVMGERTPERILAALGIPKEWFRLPEENAEGTK